MEMKNFSRGILSIPFMPLLLFGLMNLITFSANAQQITVTGTVKDAKGGPVSGASVTIKGSTTGTSTDANGAFTISVTSVQTVLVISNIGFVPKEETVGNRKKINITLADKSNDLDDVVVIGYGQTVKKRDLSGAISSVNAKQIQERQPLNLFDALQGQAAGVLIVNDGGGAPGAEGTIQVRGPSTLNGGNGPLYIVDGVINDNGASINPADIESVEVLKDAASASIYGARSANGVIIITTKKGKEGKPRIDFTYTHVFGRLAHKLPQSNSAEVREFRRIQSTNPSGGTGGSTDSLNPSFNADNDLQDLLLGNLAQRKEAKLGVSGGAQKLSYYTSLNYLDDKSIILNSYIKRVQSRINVEFQASKKFKYSNNISFYWQRGNEIPVGQTVNVAFDRPAYSLIYYPDGTLTSYIGSKRNPVANALYQKNILQTFQAQFNNQMVYEIYKDLRLTTMFNVKLSNGQLTNFSPRYIDDNKMDNRGINEMTKTFRWEVQSFLNYNKTFANDHSVTGLLGVSADRQRYDEFHMETTQNVSEEIFVSLPAYLTVSNTNTSATANSTASMFGRLGYSYKGRYLLNGSFRRDGSSRFGTKSRWGNFLAVSGAWRFSDESFMNWAAGILDDGKLRGSYGQLGNDRLDDYGSFTRVSFDENYNGIGGAYLNTTFGNPYLKWENTEQQNLGLDLSFLRGIVRITADYYVKTTKDLLYKKKIPGEAGFYDVTVNLGSIQNKGLEFAVNTIPVSRKNITWNLGGSISFERGKILELGDHIPFIAGNKWWIQEGGRIGDFYGWRNLGVYQYDVSNAYNSDWERLTPVDVSADGKTCAYYTLNGEKYDGPVHSLYGGNSKLKGGDTEWKNMNSDSVIDDADRHITGNARPDFYLGIINTVTYKQFSLSFLINASFGAQIYNTLLYNANNPSNTGAGNPELVYNVWRKQGDIAKYPYYPAKDDRGSLRSGGNSLYIEDGSFIRLSSVKLSWSLKPSLANRILVKGVTFYLFGTNLLTFTNYRGYDPEFSSGNALTPGDDSGKYPKRREAGFGVNVNF
jgi:TonB-linked SusC/RagA family outer membrane protein